MIQLDYIIPVLLRFGRLRVYNSYYIQTNRERNHFFLYQIQINLHTNS